MGKLGQDQRAALALPLLLPELEAQQHSAARRIHHKRQIHQDFHALGHIVLT
jgi:hypothetical protein